jgi:hypothetical protein
MGGLGFEQIPPAVAGEIVVGIGTSEDVDHDSSAVAWAAAQAQHADRTLCLVHAWCPWELRSVSIAASMYGCPPAFSQVEADREHAAARLALAARLVRVTFPDLRVRARLVDGHPAMRLAEVSSTAASLVVGPTSSGPIRIFGGRRMCTAVAAHANVPVIRFRSAPLGAGPVVAVAHRFSDLAAILPLTLRLAARDRRSAHALVLVPHHARRRVPWIEAALFDLLQTSRRGFGDTPLAATVGIADSEAARPMLDADSPTVVLACPRGRTAAARLRRRRVSRLVAGIAGPAVLVPIPG